LTLELVDRLVNTLNAEGVDYCHWKSNYSLTLTMAGKTDLDLLVERKSLYHILDILINSGFKPAVIRAGPETSGVSHYYGYDPQTGQLVHVHLFSHVLTGESYVKSHLLPFEPMLLEKGYYIHHLKVPIKPAELVVFILRTFIKYGSILDLINIAGNSQEIKAELCWLMSDDDLSEALNLLKKYCPVMDEQLFINCIDNLNGNNSILSRVILARKVRKRLRIYAKYTALRRYGAYFQLLWAQMARKFGGNLKNKSLDAGGLVIAFVGPEATGKSTLVSSCERWLGQVFAVRSIHAGKPPSSWLTIPINLVLPLIRALLPRLRLSRLEGHTSSINLTHSQPKVEGLPALIYALRAVSLAWDRRQLLLRARRSAASGEIVISDRYPSEMIGAMDSPRLRGELTKSGMMSVVINWLARLEQRIYKQIPPPDIVIRLKVSIETAKKRNRERIKAGNETDVYVESRHRQNREWYMSGTKWIYDIDTEQPLEETILSTKKTIWESL
jgi:thymidylate kinase